ncbi:MAG: PTS sugar transporter subunit IIA [Longicatena sp.]
MGEFNILLLTHGDAGKALLESSEMIIGKSNNLYSVSLEIGMSPESFIEKVKLILDINENETLILTDLFGGTPSNVALILSTLHQVKCVSGLNLAMLIEAIMMRNNNVENSLDNFAKKICTIGKEACRQFEINKEED